MDEAFEVHTNRLKTFKRLRDQVRAKPARAKHVQEYIVMLEDWIQSYEDGINWQTTCLNCARLMNDNYNQYCLIEELKNGNRNQDT